MGVTRLDAGIVTQYSAAITLMPKNGYLYAYKSIGPEILVLGKLCHAAIHMTSQKLREAIQDKAAACASSVTTQGPSRC